MELELTRIYHNSNDLFSPFSNVSKNTILIMLIFSWKKKLFPTVYMKGDALWAVSGCHESFPGLEIEYGT